MTDGLFKHLHRHSSRTKKRRHLTGHIDNRRLHTDSDRTSIKNHLNSSIHILPYMLSCRRTWTTGSIRTRRCNRNLRKMNQTVCNRIARHPHRHGLKTTRRSIRHDTALRKNHRQRSRPICLGKFSSRFRNFLHKGFKLLHAGNMRDQRIVRRTPLRRIDFFRCLLIQSIRTESINCLRRKCYKPSIPKNLRCLRQLLISYLCCILYFHHLCFHWCVPLFFFR